MWATEEISWKRVHIEKSRFRKIHLNFHNFSLAALTVQTTISATMETSNDFSQMWFFVTGPFSGKLLNWSNECRKDMYWLLCLRISVKVSSTIIKENTWNSLKRLLNFLYDFTMLKTKHSWEYPIVPSLKYKLAVQTLKHRNLEMSFLHSTHQFYKVYSCFSLNNDISILSVALCF